MTEVKRYHLTETGLVEGVALGRINVVLGADHDRVTAERDALQLRLNNSEQWNDELLGLLRKAAEFEVGENDSEDWQHLLSQISLQLTPIGALKPTQSGADAHVCPSCGTKGWTANCEECVPF